MKTPEELFRQGDAMHNAGNYAEAFKWFQSAADQGYHEAQLRLGFAYENGLGVEKNPAEAVHWFREAAQQGYAPAQSRMAYCYGKGFGVPRNLKTAIWWADQSGSQGFAIGQRQGRQLREKLRREGGSLYAGQEVPEFEIGAGSLIAYHGNAGTVQVPDGVQKIGLSAFENNRTVQSVTLPDGVTTLGKNAFRNCSALRSVVIPGSVELVNLESFAGCAALERLELGEGVRKLIFEDALKELGPVTIVAPDSLSSLSWNTPREADLAQRRRKPKQFCLPRGAPT